jgi:ferrous iron transport protein B
VSTTAFPLTPLRIALLGAPNSGKTTVFNALTGAHAKVGNYPGVTVERREGRIRGTERTIKVLDLPGSYSLRGESLDERIVEQVLDGSIEDKPDALLMVVDATTMQRSLAMVLEALEAHAELPSALVVTMIDEMRARGGRIDFGKLSKILGVPVLPIVGHRGVGLDALSRALQRPEDWSRAKRFDRTDEPEERYAWVDRVCQDIGATQIKPDSRSDLIDRWLLHPVFGALVFFGVMVFVFQSIFAWAVPAMDAIESVFGEMGRISRAVLPPGLLADLWADGMLAGVGSVLVFLPQIVILFTLIHFLEDVGYMARAAFVVDRIMGWVGLQGRSFVVLLSCSACAVPGIMAARTIPSPRDRLATILVAPFMTCSARLPVYTLLIAAFIPAQKIGGVFGIQGLVMFGLYALGALTALASAALLKSTVTRGKLSTFYMELPPYRFPTAKLLLSQVWNSARAFLKRAGTIIFTVSVVVWVLLNFPRAPVDPAATPEAQAQQQVEVSVAGHIGRGLEPFIAPLGFDWKIGVGLVASLAAREVIVATLAQIYAVGDPEDFEGLRGKLQNDTDPATGQPTFDIAVALSLLVFFVFALQCTSTIVVMAKETGSWKWPALAFTYMLGLAYAASFVTYNLASAWIS